MTSCFPFGKVMILVTGAHFLHFDVKVCVHSWTASECDIAHGPSCNISFPAGKVRFQGSQGRPFGSLRSAMFQTPFHGPRRTSVSPREKCGFLWQGLTFCTSTLKFVFIRGPLRSATGHPHLYRTSENPYAGVRIRVCQGRIGNRRWTTLR